MKDKIIIIILFISIVLVICLAVFGFSIGEFEIPSISTLINKNDEVNSKIDTATQLTSVEYPQQVTILEDTIGSLNIEKEKYEQLIAITDEDSDEIYETEKYDIGYLWTTIGQYATKENLHLSIDVKQSTGTDLYNLYFTVQGLYVDISSFIVKLENDSDLGFRIYNFNIVPGTSDEILKATFVVKDINIDNKTLADMSTTETNVANQETNATENTVQNELQQ